MLDSLRAEAAELAGVKPEQPVAPPPEPEQVVASVSWSVAPAAAPLPADEVAAWASLPKTIGSILCLAFPELKDAYSDANCREWGVAMVPLARENGWSVGAASPWLGVLVASVPIVVPTVVVIRARVKQGSAAPEPAPRDELAERRDGPPKTRPLEDQ